MKFETWMQSVPQEIKDDSLWKREAYRLARSRMRKTYVCPARYLLSRGCAQRKSPLICLAGTAGRDLESHDLLCIVSSTRSLKAEGGRGLGCRLLEAGVEPGHPTLVTTRRNYATLVRARDREAERSSRS